MSWTFAWAGAQSVWIKPLGKREWDGRMALNGLKEIDSEDNRLVEVAQYCVRY